MHLEGVNFSNWLGSPGHAGKDPEERWLRELYPWPVLAQVECDSSGIGIVQRISHDGVDYRVTLRAVTWQPRHCTFKYRLFVESDGLGWHSRSYSDVFEMTGTPCGEFVTLFHSKTEEPLERIARAFFHGRSADIDPRQLQTLAVSRFLTASLASRVIEEAYKGSGLEHYPATRLYGRSAPMFARGNDIWIGQRFFSDGAYAWARECSPRAAKVVGVYLADSKQQIRTALPANAEVRSMAEIDANELDGRYEQLIRMLYRRFDAPRPVMDSSILDETVRGQREAAHIAIADADVHESLAALRRRCESKNELRYQLAAGVLLNAWIEQEVSLGYVKRKKFYAFKAPVTQLVEWAVGAQLPGVVVWAENAGGAKGRVTFVRIDGVDFSFSALPIARDLIGPMESGCTWSGVRLKPMAPLVLQWARMLRDSS